MRISRNSGQDGRRRVRRIARPAYVFVAVAFSLALKPAPVMAQLSFVMAGNVATSVLAPAIVQQLPDAQAAPTGEATELSPREEFALLAERTVATAGRYVGTRYRWGGDAPGRGFDCSGFVRYVYGQQGIDLPRVSRAQARAGRPVQPRLDELRPGDLLFFAQRGPLINHVAIYAGDGRIVHASRRGYGVRYDDLNGPNGRAYMRQLVAVRRILDDSQLLEAVAEAAAGAADEPDVPLGEPVQVLVAEQTENGATAVAPLPDAAL